jgi:stage II sporulation protein D
VKQIHDRADGLLVRTRWTTPVGAFVAGVAAAAAVLAVVVPATAQATEVYPRPQAGALHFVGRGFGHGIGMSQFGAEGMGRSGKNYHQILAFYYPGTTMSKVANRANIRVQLSAAPHRVHGYASVTFDALPGSFAGVVGQAPAALPRRVAGARVSTYRVVRTSGGLQLLARSASGRRVLISAQPDDIVVGAETQNGSSVTSNVSLSQVTVREGATSRRYRGEVTVHESGSGVVAINVVRLQQYLYGVVGAEVPGGWTNAAYAAQAVAARSYALLMRHNARASHTPWDICDTICQAYGGVAWESASQSRAVDATAGRYLSYHGLPALTMFSSADGGYTVAGSQPYLVAEPDPYDGVVTGAANWGHAWRASVTAGTIEANWPQIGRLTAVVVAARDGLGRWGGRVTALRLRGRDATVVVSADEFRWTLGLKSTWWRIDLPQHP